MKNIRRKSKDNPYTIYYDEEIKTYKIIFVDSLNRKQEIEINEDVYNVFDKSELKDISQMHEFERHIEHSQLFEDTLYHRSLKKPISIEDEVEIKLIHDELKKALNKLSAVKKRRIIMYYFEDKTEEEIAKIENISHQAISKSIRGTILELKEILKKFNF